MQSLFACFEEILDKMGKTGYNAPRVTMKVYRFPLISPISVMKTVEVFLTVRSAPCPESASQQVWRTGSSGTELTVVNALPDGRKQASASIGG